MKKFAIIVLAAIIAQAAPSVAGAGAARCTAKPNSFVPHSHTNRHVYGSPIAAPIVGRAKTTHHRQTYRAAKKRS
jgi:hypothetical protein